MDIAQISSLSTGEGPLVVVDDDDSQLNLIEKTFQISKSKRKLKLFNTGKDFIKKLEESLKNGTDIPSYVLLDINMPELSGYDVLRKIKSLPNLRPIPVFMFSVSSRPEDMEKSKTLNANGYFSKPGSLKDYVEFFNKF
jgi:CheY-like chemotaxis protein